MDIFMAFTFFPLILHSNEKKKKFFRNSGADSAYNRADRGFVFVRGTWSHEDPGRLVTPRAKKAETTEMLLKASKLSVSAALKLLIVFDGFSRALRFGENHVSLSESP